ncbi:MAG: glycosyltransferase family 1 protein [Deltaproteobacteria bacterium]|nr:glycosyltransferase family 1 protein [Deltaproteobacteria bacterium]
MWKIFINTTPLLGPRTGIANYTLNIAQRLLNNPNLALTFFDGAYTPKLPDSTHTSRTARQGRLIRLLKKAPLLYNLLKDLHNRSRGRLLKNSTFDLYFEPNFIPFSVPARHLVITIYDFSFHLHRDWHPRDRVLYFQRHFWPNLSRAQHFIFISDFIRKSAIEEFGFDSRRCTTIHCGVDSHVFRPKTPEELTPVRQRYNLFKPFILFTGSVEPRKNLQNLLKAYLSLPGQVKEEVGLLLAGFSGWQNEAIMRILRANQGHIRYLGYVPEADLACLYNLAEFFVYPSFYEGFGLPPLEAMACGTPVIVSHAASLPEVCADAALYVNPHDVNDIANAMLRLLTDSFLRQNLAQQGQRRAALFSWDMAAEQHLQLFERILTSA